MSLAHEAKIAALILESRNYLERLSSVSARINRCPANDLEALRKLARSAALNASDLEGCMSDLADAAFALECEEADAKPRDPFAYINLSSAGGAL